MSVEIEQFIPTVPDFERPHIAKAPLLVLDGLRARRILIASIMALHGYRCEHAETFTQSQLLIESKSYSFILVDGDLPETEAIHLIELLLKHRRGLFSGYNAATPLVLLGESKSDCFRRFDPVLLCEKPIRESSLASALKLSGGRVRQ